MSKSDIDKIRKQIQERKRPEMVVPICLRGDITAEIYELDRQLSEVSKSVSAVGDGRLNGNDKARALGEKIQALREEAAEATVKVRVRALERRQWRGLIEKFPGKTKDQLFDPAMYNEAVPLSIVEPELDSDTLGKFLDELTDGQFDDLSSAVHIVNAGDGDVPFSVLASRASQPSDETPKQPEPTA
jgi:hypothetical protein